MIKNERCMKTIRKYKITNVNYLLRLRRYKAYFRKWFKTNGIHGNQFDIEKKGLHFLFAYADLINLRTINIPINGESQDYELGEIDHCIISKNLVVVYDMDKHYFRICHATTQNGVLPLNEYIDSMADVAKRHPYEEVQFDNSNPIVIRIKVMENNLTKEVKDISITKFDLINSRGFVSVYNCLQVLGHIDRIERRRRNRENRKENCYARNEDGTIE